MEPVTVGEAAAVILIVGPIARLLWVLAYHSRKSLKDNTK